jgi:hypothetical protein
MAGLFLIDFRLGGDFGGMAGDFSEFDGLILLCVRESQ